MRFDLLLKQMLILGASVNLIFEELKILEKHWTMRPQLKGDRVEKLNVFFAVKSFSSKKSPTYQKFK